MTSKWFWRKFTPRKFRTFVGEANLSAHAQEAELQKRRSYKKRWSYKIGGATKEAGSQKRRVFSKQNGVQLLRECGCRHWKRSSGSMGRRRSLTLAIRVPHRDLDQRGDARRILRAINERHLEFSQELCKGNTWACINDRKWAGQANQKNN